MFEDVGEVEVQLRVLFPKVNDLQQEGAVLGPLRESVAELIQCPHTEPEHLAVLLLAQSLEDVAEGDAQRGGGDEFVLDEETKEDTGDSKLLCRVFVKELVLIKQVVNHTLKQFLLLVRTLETLQHSHHLLEGHLLAVDLLELGVGLLLDRLHVRGLNLGVVGRVQGVEALELGLGAHEGLVAEEYPEDHPKRRAVHRQGPPALTFGWGRKDRGLTPFLFGQRLLRLTREV
jgi:hypothetical protein